MGRIQIILMNISSYVLLAYVATHTGALLKCVSVRQCRRVYEVLQLLFLQST